MESKGPCLSPVSVLSTFCINLQSRLSTKFISKKGQNICCSQKKTNERGCRKNKLQKYSWYKLINCLLQFSLVSIVILFCLDIWVMAWQIFVNYFNLRREKRLIIHHHDYIHVYLVLKIYLKVCDFWLLFMHIPWPHFLG